MSVSNPAPRAAGGRGPDRPSDRPDGPAAGRRDGHAPDEVRRPAVHRDGHAPDEVRRPAVHRDGHAPDDAHGRAILLALREAGAAGADAIAGRIGMSRASTLQRLRELQGAGFVARQALRHGVGRPRHVYDITAAAQRSLPANYDGLATTLLESISEVGGNTLVEEVLQARRRLLRDRVLARFAERLGPRPSLAEKVRELAVIQDESGYLCRAETAPVDGGQLKLREHNCAILGAAAGHPAVCQAELELFEDVLEARVVRTSHIASGDRCCTYHIEPRDT